MSNVPAASPPASNSNRSWLGRHKILAILILLLTIVLVGGYVLALPYLKPLLHSRYAAALEEIRKSPVARERLGEPIRPVRIFPSGDFTETTAKLTFEVEGPKERAEVAAFSRMIDGEWGNFTTLELKFKNGDRLELAQGSDIPKWDPNAKRPEVKEPDMPPNVELPSFSPDPEKK